MSASGVLKVFSLGLFENEASLREFNAVTEPFSTTGTATLQLSEFSGVRMMEENTAMNVFSRRSRLHFVNSVFEESEKVSVSCLCTTVTTGLSRIFFLRDLNNALNEPLIPSQSGPVMATGYSLLISPSEVRVMHTLYETDAMSTANNLVLGSYDFPSPLQLGGLLHLTLEVDCSDPSGVTHVRVLKDGEEILAASVNRRRISNSMTIEKLSVLSFIPALSQAVGEVVVYDHTKLPHARYRIANLSAGLPELSLAQYSKADGFTANSNDFSDFALQGDVPGPAVYANIFAAVAKAGQDEIPPHAIRVNLGGVSALENESQGASGEIAFSLEELASGIDLSDAASSFVGVKTL